MSKRHNKLHGIEDSILTWIMFGIFYVIGWIIGSIYRMIVWAIRRAIAKHKARPKAFEQPEETRFSHTHIVAGSGHGKTQLLQNLFLEDIPHLQAGNCSVVIVDSQGDMIRKILRLRDLWISKSHQDTGISLPEVSTIKPRSQTATPPPNKSIWLHVWHGFLVFLFLLGVALLGVGAILATTNMLPPNHDWVGFLTAVPFGILAGAWIKRQKSHPSFIVVSISSAFFIAPTLYVGVAILVYYVLAVTVAVFVGFIITSPVKMAEGSAIPVEETVPRRVEPVKQSLSSLADRLVLIDPTDVEYPPCLNLFDFGLDRIGNYNDMLERQKLLNGAVSLYEYIFGALLGAEMTPRQTMLFEYLSRLLMVVPGATIHTLRGFMEHPELIDEHLMKLDTDTRRFFIEEFPKNIYDPNRQQISSRLWAILANETLAKMFSHPHNKVDLFTAMNNGSLILINVAKDLLKDKAEVFGKFMIALINQATLERSVIPEGQRFPTYVYIDEAADYLDKKVMGEMINQARKYKVGLILSHQNLGQLSTSMEETIMASTATKFVGGLSDKDARAFAPEFRCKPEELQMMQKTATESHFAFYVRNLMPEPATFVVELGKLDRMPQMTEKEYQEVIALNRKRYCDTVKEVEHAVTIPRQTVKAFDLEEPPAI